MVTGLDPLYFQSRHAIRHQCLQRHCHDTQVLRPMRDFFTPLAEEYKEHLEGKLERL